MNAMIRALAAAAALALAAPLAAQVPEIPFDSNADLLQTPANVFVGEVGGVGRNSRGHIFVYTRTGHPWASLGDNRTFARNGSRLFEFDPTGKFVRELGQQVYGFNAAFGLRVDPLDNVWVIDQAANQVIKFDPAGNVALVLGRKPEAIQVRPRAENASPPPTPQPPPPGQPVPPSPDRPGPATPARPSSAPPTWPGTRRATSTSRTASATTTGSRSTTRKAASSASGATPAPRTGNSRA